MPCWIMPTWRVAEQLPAELGAVEIVIIDEASQSDVTELPALLRGKKILVVGDDRQVSPTAPFVTQEKIGQLRLDIYVPHGARGKRQRINPAEAEVILEEIAALTSRPEMRNRTIGVISLVGTEQAVHIRSRLSETIGEEIMQRHSILCGDSATFQGSERDIVFLSMVADSANKTALTMLRYEQRFNVAVSRARDRVVLVRSVKREELNPNDLKARLIAHFENPMPELEEVEDALAVCESDFERDLMQKLLDRGYRVEGQVGSIGYRIDMVVEGADRRRLAVECDGDRFHGPEQWRQDMRRQRVLERVGWRFWRCFASSFYRDPDVVLNDLLDMLTRMGIEPIAKGETGRTERRFTEHRTIEPAPAGAEGSVPGEDPIDLGAFEHGAAETAAPAAAGIGLGDKVVLVFSDDGKRISARLSESGNDLDKGRLALGSAARKSYTRLRGGG